MLQDSMNYWTNTSQMQKRHTITIYSGLGRLILRVYNLVHRDLFIALRILTTHYLLNQSCQLNVYS